MFLSHVWTFHHSVTQRRESQCTRIDWVRTHPLFSRSNDLFSRFIYVAADRESLISLNCVMLFDGCRSLGEIRAVHHFRQEVECHHRAASSSRCHGNRIRTDASGFDFLHGNVIHLVRQSDCEGRRTSFPRISDLSTLPFLISLGHRCNSQSSEWKERELLAPVDRHRTEAILTPSSPFDLLFTRPHSIIERQLRKRRSRWETNILHTSQGKVHTARRYFEEEWIER